MAYSAKFVQRWKRHFGDEPWWGMLLAFYDGPGQDWEDARAVLDSLIFALGQARKIDVMQICPGCQRWAYEIPTFSQDRHCAACEAAEEARRAENTAIAERARARSEAVRSFELSLLTPTEREAYLRREQDAVANLLAGLALRHVK